MPKSTLKELIVLSRQNDAGAFRKLVEMHQAMIYSLAFRLLCNEEDARDAVQETFIKVWRFLPRYNSEMKFTTWLYAIATNLCYDKLKSTRRKPVAVSIDQELLTSLIAGENMEQTIINSELARIIRTLTGELTPRQKLVFTLRDLEGLETDEIETITRLSAGKIKSNLYLARQFIRKRLENL
jgi:RNA polymerase sigma-70 factor, ECF subfamily